MSAATDRVAPTPKPAGYFSGCNQALLRAVPPAARRILDIGCGEGALGAALRRQNPFREVVGVEREPAAAAVAGRRLNRVFTADVEAGELPLDAGGFDCVLFGDVLEHLHNPATVLRHVRRFLKPGGQVLCSVPNVQHHSVVAALLRSDFQYADSGLLDATHLKFFTYSTLIKLFLDAGFAPDLLADTRIPAAGEFLEAAGPLLQYLGLHPERTARYLAAYQYVVRGVALPEVEPGPASPLSVVVCVSDEATLQANLLASPCLRRDHPHEVIALRGCASAAGGLNAGIRRARHPVVVCVHQDVYLPEGWPQRFVAQCRKAEATVGNLGVVGVYGVSRAGRQVIRAGHIIDRDRLLWEPPGLPAPVDALDEVVLAVRRGTPLRFDPALGFHLYGADVCLAARKQGLAAVAVDALCFHNSRSVGLPEAFAASAGAFGAKWYGELPVVTPCAWIEPDGLRPFGAPGVCAGAGGARPSPGSCGSNGDRHLEDSEPVPIACGRPYARGSDQEMRAAP